MLLQNQRPWNPLHECVSSNKIYILTFFPCYNFLLHEKLSTFKFKLPDPYHVWNNCISIWTCTQVLHSLFVVLFYPNLCVANIPNHFAHLSCIFMIYSLSSFFRSNWTERTSGFHRFYWTSRPPGFHRIHRTSRSYWIYRTFWIYWCHRSNWS